MNLSMCFMAYLAHKKVFQVAFRDIKTITCMMLLQDLQLLHSLQCFPMPFIHMYLQNDCIIGSFGTVEP